LKSLWILSQVGLHLGLELRPSFAIRTFLNRLRGLSEALCVFPFTGQLATIIDLSSQQ
jgi:hypothetical protein